MIQYAKLINGQLTYYTQGSMVNIQGIDVINPTIEMLDSEGYKEVIYSEGLNGTYEDGDYIIIETPPQIIPSANDLREIAYNQEPIIMWDGKLRTCDFVRGLMVTYKELEEYDKLTQLKELWLAGRLEIQNKYA